jgi:hypothetical protein
LDDRRKRSGVLAIDEDNQLSVLREVLGGWRTFWFKPQPAYTLGLVRMGFGAVMVLWALTLLPNLYELFGHHGVMPQRPSRPFTVNILDLCTSDHKLLLAWTVLLLSSIALTVGWHTRIASILVFVLVYSFVQGYREAFNAGDALLGIEALVLALAGSSPGAALSLDQRRETGLFWSAQCRAPWPTRLLQVQLSLVYLANVRAKVSGETWVDGTAVSYAWRRDLSFSYFPAPHWLYDSALLVNVATWSALVIELSLGVLIWNRRCRPWVLLVGVGMHLSIMLTMDVAFFSFAVFVAYLAFVSPDAVRRLPEMLKRLVARRARRRQPIVVATMPAEAPLHESRNGDGPQTGPDSETSGSAPTPLDAPI